MAPTGHSEERSTAQTRNDGFRMDRRTWLGVMGAAVAGGAAASGTAGASHGDWHELVLTEPDELHYEFTCTGEIQKVTDGSPNEAEGNDEVWANGDGTWTAQGVLFNGKGDTFQFRGECVEFGPLDGDFTLELDGSVVTADELIQHNAIAIGGGADYYRKVPQSEATTTVSTYSELDAAMDNATAGDVVYVDPATDIDMGSNELKLPEGVTLASDRGIGGSPGGRLYTNDTPRKTLNVVNTGVRITGLRIEGYLGATDGWAPYRDDWQKESYGVWVEASDVEVDNCEIYGWSYSGSRASSDTHFHHNTIHHNRMKGLGYGISTSAGQPLIEWNQFYHNRHSIAGQGNSGYTARFNHVTGTEAIAGHFDMHDPGGVTRLVHHNTFEPVNDDDHSGKLPAVLQRGVPDDTCTVWNNWFYNPEAPLSSPNGYTDEAIIQATADSWQNVSWRDNHYGSSEPADAIGHPRNLEANDPTPVFEDFERSNPLAEYGAKADQYSVETSTVYEGSQALTHASGAEASAVSTSGLNSYPGRGDKVSLYINNAQDDNFAAFHLFAQSETDNPNSYVAGLSNYSAWKLWVIDDSGVTLIDEQALPTSDQIDGWYRVEMWTDSTTVYADLYNDASDALLASVQADDTTWSSGGIGFRSAGNGEVWDYIVEGSSQGPTVVDSFEDGDLSEYTVQGSGLQTSQAFSTDGSASLEQPGVNGGHITSGSGLNAYPQRGDRFVIDWRSDAASSNTNDFARPRWEFGDDAGNGNTYAIAVRVDAETLDLRDVGNGQRIDANFDVPIAANTTYQIQVEWDDGTTFGGADGDISIDLVDTSDGSTVASVSGNDTDYAGGSIGFDFSRNADGQNYYTDYWRITNR